VNRYGLIAQRYWTTYLPARTAALPDPVEFFADLGEEIEEMVLSLDDDLAGPDIPGEEYLAKVGRLRNGRMRAEEIALAELIYSQTPEPGTEHLEPQRSHCGHHQLINLVTRRRPGEPRRRSG
jgi:hypothetical protein